MTDAEFAQLEAELFDDYGLPLNGLHGARHWRRVDKIGRLLAVYTEADLEVVRRFALFHDSQRYNEEKDLGHGQRAADRARQFCADELSQEQMQLLYLACAGHESGLTSDDPTIGTCWDADRLDIDRLDKLPWLSLISTDLGAKIAKLSTEDRLDWANLEPWVKKPRGIFRESQS
ncbi:MAG: hypothetical protein KF760_27225 [Candidatus Eremiobacteraeota bacterium]|nr:hypothetical protein [Candidatus Eremiobacteraeota bacterium]MCW5871969.1 hypothetical protein [Candidatus Eremiobacteraeota bacterium]